MTGPAVPCVERAGSGASQLLLFKSAPSTSSVPFLTGWEKSLGGICCWAEPTEVSSASIHFYFEANMVDNAILQHN